MLRDTFHQGIHVCSDKNDIQRNKNDNYYLRLLKVYVRPSQVYCVRRKKPLGHKKLNEFDGWHIFNIGKYNVVHLGYNNSKYNLSGNNKSKVEGRDQ